jgi:hypothetical protein
MTAVEDRLRESLVRTAEQVDPSADAWARIEHRTAPRSSTWQHILVPASILLVVAVAVAGLRVFTPRRRVVAGAAATRVSPTTTRGRSIPALPAVVPANDGPMTGIWPARTVDDIDELRSLPGPKWWNDPAEVAQRFLVQVAGLEGVAVQLEHNEFGSASVAYSTGTSSGAVSLALVGETVATSIWTVTSASSSLVEADSRFIPLQVNSEGTISWRVHEAGELSVEFHRTDVPGRALDIAIEHPGLYPTTVRIGRESAFNRAPLTGPTLVMPRPLDSDTARVIAVARFTSNEGRIGFAVVMMGTPEYLQPADLPRPRPPEVVGVRPGPRPTITPTTLPIVGR